MNNALSLLENPFEFTEIPIRTALGTDGEPWFCAQDICLALDISWSGSGITLRNMPQDWVSTIRYMGEKGERDMVFINEAGLFRLAFRSNKPTAEEFANWVCGVVLRELRKNGFYGTAKISITERIALSKQIIAVESALMTTKRQHEHEVLVAELHALYNLIGRKLPDKSKMPLLLDQPDIVNEFGQFPKEGGK